MAYTATTTDFSAKHSFLARIGDAIKSFASAYVEARSRQGAIAALEAMSDKELAERGIEREDIVRHVFSDTYYL